MLNKGRNKGPRKGLDDDRNNRPSSGPSPSLGLDPRTRRFWAVVVLEGFELSISAWQEAFARIAHARSAQRRHTEVPSPSYNQIIAQIVTPIAMSSHSSDFAAFALPASGVPRTADPQIPLGYSGVLEHLGILRVSGPEAGRFLQAQLSNDVGALGSLEPQPEASRSSDCPDPAAQWTGYCTPKGRLIFTGWLVRSELCSASTSLPSGAISDPGYLLLMDRELVESVLRRLRMFVLRSKVLLEDLSAQWRITGLIRQSLDGPDNREVRQGRDAIESWDAIAQRGFELPPVHFASGCRLVRFAILTSRDADREASAGPNIDFTALWHWVHHLGAEAWVGRAASERFVPQMLNFERIGGVSFRKGCYPGQEVVARSQYLGKLKRRMGLYAWADDSLSPPSAGADLGADASNPELGVVSTACRPLAGPCDSDPVVADPFLDTWRIAYPEGGPPPQALILAEGRSDHHPTSLQRPLALPYALTDA